MDHTMLKCGLAIFALPLVSFVVLGLFNKRLPRRGDFIATSVMGLALGLSLYVFWRAWSDPRPVFVNLSFAWLPMEVNKAVLGGILIDRLTAVMLVVVTLVSFLVHLFSTKYMEGDVRYGRYFAGLLLFTVSMLGLVLANNLLYLYMFWELVGLTSYILIGHWFEKKSASDAAIKAFITTRLGDVGMFIGIMVCYLQVGSLQYGDLFAAVEQGGLSGAWRTIAGLGLFFGAMGKSAQFPLHVWLPDAMEGPTPVSALIHAATMVAAGVYLTGRLLPVFDPPTLLFIAYIGGFTALFAATIALVQDDIKKVLAYSTVSQLGYMILALGVGGYVSGLFHLTTHAFFKAGLFLGAGAVIHAMHHEQSMSKYGGLRRKMPITTVCYLLATLALAGFPGFSGFWSKDAILADVLAFAMLNGHWFLVVAGFSTVFLTAFYMFRQFFLTFTGKPRDHHAYDHAHESPLPMLIPLIVLGTLAVVGGGMGGWFGAMNPAKSGVEQVRGLREAGFTTPLMDSVVQQSHDAETPHAASSEAHGDPLGDAHAGEHSPEAEARHKAHYMAMGLSTCLALAGILLGAAFYLQRKDGKTLLDPGRVAQRCSLAHRILWNKYYLDEAYMACFVMTTRALAVISATFDRLIIDGIVNLAGWCGWAWSYLTEIFDRIVVDGWFVNGSAQTTAYMGRQVNQSQTGYVRQYLMLTVLGLLIISSVCAYAFYGYWQP
ncbi:MAG TPA: NADH-quinone oxidoreductase subunit L [Candidatus Hydrogenedentes bacterium]|nr:NADH-quinone oxidoreductase subunit L [Candidatus Hydrogenedentota bacterium]